VEKQIAIIFAGGQGMLDSLPVSSLRLFEQDLYKFLDNSKAGVLQMIREKKVLDETVKGDLTAAIKEFKDRFVVDQNIPTKQTVNA
jgi:F-type H+-transporting ATPase subunit alpha